MKLSSTSGAKLFLVLSIAIATVSGWKGLEWYRQVQSLTTQLRTAKDDENRARQEASQLAAALPDSEAALPLTPTVLALVNTLNQGQLAYRVQVGSLSPQTLSSNTSLDLTELAQPVGNTELRSFMIQVRGTYREYSGLRAYLKQLESHPVAIHRVAVAGNTFELDIKVYGTLTT